MVMGTLHLFNPRLTIIINTRLCLSRCDNVSQKSLLGNASNALFITWTVNERIIIIVTADMIDVLIYRRVIIGHDL